MADRPGLQEQDDQLIASALQGDQKAYEALLARHNKAIFHVVMKIVRNREEAQDLVQETFMKAFNALASYRSEYRFSTWLYKIAANCAIDFIRKKRIEALSLDKPIETKDGRVEFEVPDSSWNPEQDLVRKQKLKSIEEAIDSLPDKYREVIIYRHKDDKPYEEIADILKVPVGTVKARIFRARELLKKKLKPIR
ncbi:MAG: sigma-70 family RNA polymerase sigma factor [candidate division Zixibacteria bacterium]|nr:sigma-70 family RNA polymerase sigma factor [candidate division Zixibacteria bacterium]